MQELPAVPGARFAVGTTDRSGDGGTEWADRIVLDDGRLAVVLGRLPGREPGERAAPLVERLRGAVAMGVLRGDRDGERLLADIHRLTRHEHDLRGATLSIALFDPASGAVECASAGRPGPWLIDGAGGMRQLLGARTGPLGNEHGDGEVERFDGVHRVSEGEAVVLYGADSTSTAASLAERVYARGSTDPVVLCGGVEVTAGQHGRATLLAFTRVPVPSGSLTVERPAEAVELPGIRRQFDLWLDSVGCPPELAHRLVLALSEAVTNSVEHAYRGRDTATVRVTGAIEQDRSIRVTVADRGRWQVPRPDGGYRGRGLLMMQESVDRVAIERTAEGTTLSLWVQPHAVDTMARIAERSRATGDHDLDVQVHGEVVSVLVRGDVPENGAVSLRRGLLAASYGAALRMVVDLGGLGTEIGGVVHALFDVADAMRDAGERLVVRAPSGSPVRALAEMAGLHQVSELVDGPPPAG